MPIVEFAYNNYVNRSTGKSPFEVVQGYSPRILTDLVALPPNSHFLSLLKILSNISLNCMLRFSKRLLHVMKI